MHFTVWAWKRNTGTAFQNSFQTCIYLLVYFILLKLNKVESGHERDMYECM